MNSNVMHMARQRQSRRLIELERIYIRIQQSYLEWIKMSGMQINDEQLCRRTRTILSNMAIQFIR